MALLTPIALLLLIPWGIVVVLAMRSKTSAAIVPFLELWDRQNLQSISIQRRRLPPLSILLLLTAILLGIFSAAGVTIKTSESAITVVIDCRLPMSPPKRIQSALKALALRGDQLIHIIPVPGEPFTTYGSIDPDRLRFTANPDDADLHNALRAELTVDRQRIYVVTDEAIPITDERIKKLTPSLPLSNVCIDRFTVTDGEHPQAMVRVVNDCEQRSAVLKVDQVSQTIELPPRGERRDYFLSLPKLSDRAQAHLEINDDIAADNTAYLVRGEAWPAIEMRDEVSGPLRRMVTVYQNHRPTSANSPAIRVVSNPASAEGLSVVVTGISASEPVSDGSIHVDSPSTIARDIDWSAVILNAKAGASPPADWHAVVSRGTQVLVAARDSPRAVWVTINDANWSKRPDYVVFWTNVFDWIGGGDPSFSNIALPAALDHAAALQQADAGIIDSPGIYQEANGRFVAKAIPAVRSIASPAPSVQPPDALQTEALVPISKWLLFAAAAVCALALGLRPA